MDLIRLAGFLTVEGYTVRRNPAERLKRTYRSRGPAEGGDTSDRMDELDAITAVVQMYVDGAAQADVGRMKEAFEESARMFGDDGDERSDMPISESLEYVATTPSPGRVPFPRHEHRCGRRRSGGVLAEDDCHGVDYVDFFSLIKLDGTWKIVIKLSAGDRPDAYRRGLRADPPCVLDLTPNNAGRYHWA